MAVVTFEGGFRMQLGQIQTLEVGDRRWSSISRLNYILDLKQKIKWFPCCIFQCNGMSNRFWGWGREDDEFYRRLRKAELQVKVSTANSVDDHRHLILCTIRVWFSLRDQSELFFSAAVQTEWNHNGIQNVPPHPRPGLEEEGPEEGGSPETGTGPQLTLDALC